MSGGGFVKIYRSICDNPHFRSDAEAMVFCYLLINAQWKDTEVRYKGRLIELKRGQIAISYRDLAAKMERPLGYIQRLLKRFKTDTLIDTPTDTPSDTLVNVVSICNYDRFQACLEESDTPSDTPTDTPTDTQNKKRLRNTKNISSLRSDIPHAQKAIMPEWLDLETWKAFKQMRVKIKKPMTEKAEQLLLSKIDKLREKGHNPTELLNQSIIHCWQTVYEPKGGNDGKRFNSSGKPSVSEGVLAARHSLGYS